jgi:hypothetical protein
MSTYQATITLCTRTLTLDRAFVGIAPPQNSRPAGFKLLRQQTHVPSKLTGFLNTRDRYVTASPAVVDPGQLAAIAAEPVAEVAALAGVGALCARQGLLPLQGRCVHVEGSDLFPKQQSCFMEVYKQAGANRRA